MNDGGRHDARAQDLADYVGEAARRVRDVLGDRLVGVWLVGSVALGDYDPRRSDVDVQAVATGRLPRAERLDLATWLAEGARACPARGLEFVLYDRVELAADGGPRFQLNLDAGPRMEHHVALHPDEDPRFWFTLDAAIARQAGRALIGPSPAQVFPELPRALVADAVRESLDFYAALPGTGEQALLGACRAWAWATDGRWRAKGASARWAMRRLADPAPVARTLARRDGEPAEPPAAHEVDLLLARARQAVAAVAAPAQ